MKKSRKSGKSGDRARTKRNTRSTRSVASAETDSATSVIDVPSVLRAHAAEVASLFPTDGKLYYRIGEVSQITGVKPYVLRYWESEFRWMSPQKSRSQQRLYRPKDIEMVLLIRRLLHQERYTIAGARKKLRELGMGKALEEAAEQQQAHPAGADELSHLDFCRQLRHELEAIRELI